MAVTLRRNSARELLLLLESTPGFPATHLVHRKLGEQGLRILPAELSDTAPLTSDAVIACRTGSTAAAALARMGIRCGKLSPSAYRIQSTQVQGNRCLVVVGGDLFGMLAGLADLLRWSSPASSGLTYRGGDRTETPAFPLRYYWTWDHSTNWMLDDPGLQVEGCNNQYLKRPETYLEDYRRLIDHCVETRFNAVLIWGFLRDTHGGEDYAYQIARYAADRGVAILPGVGTTGYGGVYYEGNHPANLETHLARHPQMGNMGADGRVSARESSPYHRENQQWIARSLAWLYNNFPIGGVNLENNDLMVDHSPAGKRGRSRIKSDEADYFKDQFFAYKTALDVAHDLAPQAWNTYATYSGFGRGKDVSNAGADMGRVPYFAKHMPASAIAQWTLTGMLSSQPVPLAQWLDNPRPAQVYQNPRWSKGTRPPTPRSTGFIHQASQWSAVRRSACAISLFAEACLRSHEEGLEGLSIHGEVCSRTLSYGLNYLAMRHWTYHPVSTLGEFAARELTPVLGDPKAAADFVQALSLLESGKPDDAYKIASTHSRATYPYPFQPLPASLDAHRMWYELAEWATLTVHPQWAHGFHDMV